MLEAKKAGGVMLVDYSSDIWSWGVMALGIMSATPLHMANHGLTDEQDLCYFYLWQCRARYCDLRGSDCLQAAGVSLRPDDINGWALLDLIQRCL